MKIIDLEEYRAKKRNKSIVIYIDAVGPESFAAMVKNKPVCIAKVIRDALKEV